MWLLLLFWDPAAASSAAQMLTTSDKNLESKTWGVGGREKEITQDSTWREIRGRIGRESKPAVSKSCPVVFAMPRAKQAFYQFLGLRFIPVMWFFLPHKSVHDSACEEGSSVEEHLLANRPIDSSRQNKSHDSEDDLHVNSDVNRRWMHFWSFWTSTRQLLSYVEVKSDHKKNNMAFYGIRLYLLIGTGFPHFGCKIP